MNEFSPISQTQAIPAYGWFKAVRSDDALELIRANKNAFILVYIIATRARWRSGFNQHGLCPGEAMLGDFENYGMSEKEYRTAKRFLEKWKFAAFKRANKGSIGSLCDERLFCVLEYSKAEQNGRQRATSGRTEGGQRATNEEGKTEKKDRQDESNKDSLASLKANPKARKTQELMERCKLILGKCEMSKPGCHRLWLQRSEQHPDKLQRVLADTEAANRQGEIKTTAAQYAQHRWKEFAE